MSTRSLLLALPFLAACEPPPGPPPPTYEEVYEVRDSIREALLLRISNALHEINRQTEMKSRRAYSEPPAKARELRREVEILEGYYQRLDSRLEYLQRDSVLGEWYEQAEELEVQLLDLGYRLGHPL